MEQSGTARRRIHARRGRQQIFRRATSGHEDMSDVMDALADLPPGSPLAELRRQRLDVVKHLQGSDDVIFSPADDGGLTRAERAAAALRVATLLRDTVLSGHYRDRLAALDPEGMLAKTVEGSARITEGRWDAILAHVDLVT